jgi:Protein of unknown function (DUF1488)
MPEQIVFPQLRPVFVFERNCVAFPSLVDGRVVRCLISVEALHKDYGANGFSEEEAMRAFNEHRAQIEEAARRKLKRSEISPEGELLIRAHDPDDDEAIQGLIHLIPSLELSKDENAAIRRKLFEITSQYIGRVASKSYKVKAYWDSATIGGDIFQITLEDIETSAKTVDWFSSGQLNDPSYLRRRFDFLWSEFLSARSSKQLEKLRAGKEEA